jgi:hypothetical protein
MYFSGVEVSWDKKVNMDKTRQVHNPWFLGTREIPVEEFYLEISISDIP